MHAVPERSAAPRRSTLAIVLALVVVAIGPAGSAAGAVTTSGGPGGPDVVAPYAGGVAARLHTGDGGPLPGDLFLLFAKEGSDAPARTYDDTPYTHDRGLAAETVQSNRTAVEVVGAITATDPEPLELTSAPGGGASGGLIYAIGYLDVLSDGAFTADLRVSATGRLDRRGDLSPIHAVNEKVAAAHAAGADVVFTPSMPRRDVITAFGARRVGELGRTLGSGSPLTDVERSDHYLRWGGKRPPGMDVVVVRNLGDVAAYLCGAGSDDACDTLGRLGEDPFDDGSPSLAGLLPPHERDR